MILIYNLNDSQALTSELNAIFESSFDGLMVVDKFGTLIRVNSSWEKICGFSRDEILGKKVSDLVSSGYWDKSCALLTLEKEDTESVMIEITKGPKKGQKIMATGTPSIDKDGNLDLAVMNIRDYTALEGLKKQLEESQALNRLYAAELNEIHLQQTSGQHIVATSIGMQKALNLVTRVSQVDSSVVITGESGVGKEVIAKRIHLLSNRKNKSLIKINCGAIPENLLESELFGYEGGAFTGAKKEGKPGMFELASGGTLFLDEIGDMPLNLQAKLLRVLQEHEFMRVGGIELIKVNTRIIAATNKDLLKMVSEGSFREDLFYRLNVVQIALPPLRDRREDIPALVTIIMQRLNSKYCLNKSLSTSVMKKLHEYNWPGNIRQLENVIESIVVLTGENIIQIEHLHEFLQNETVSSPVLLNRVVPLKEAIQELEIQLLRKTLQEHKTTRKMAKILEVNQSTIVRKMQQYHLDNN